MAEWYYAKGNDEKIGPLTIDQLARAFLNGEINADTYIQKEGMQKWRRFDRLSVYEKLNAMRAEMARKNLSESFLKDTSPDVSTSYVANKKAVSVKPADTNNNTETPQDGQLELSLASQAATYFSYVPYAIREVASWGIWLSRHAIAITAYGAILLVLFAEINSYANLKIGFLDTVHTYVRGSIKGRGIQTTFEPTCDDTANERRMIALDALNDKVKLFEELGELGEAEKIRQRISQIETIEDNCNR
ncbi:MAG: DUF4339 domain-containing protein [Nitrospinae bacterium]|nr:DUF4339 domain-containing protein [Nitrospinota bacterium]